MDLESFRREYLSGGLSRKDLQDDPFDQFSLWMEQALGLGIIDPTAMTMSNMIRHGWGTTFPACMTDDPILQRLSTRTRVES